MLLTLSFFINSGGVPLDGNNVSLAPHQSESQLDLEQTMSNHLETKINLLNEGTKRLMRLNNNCDFARQRENPAQDEVQVDVCNVERMYYVPK